MSHFGEGRQSNPKYHPTRITTSHFHTQLVESPAIGCFWTRLPTRPTPAISWIPGGYGDGGLTEPFSWKHLVADLPLSRCRLPVSAFVSEVVRQVLEPLDPGPEPGDRSARKQPRDRLAARLVLLVHGNRAVGGRVPPFWLTVLWSNRGRAVDGLQESSHFGRENQPVCWLRDVTAAMPEAALG
jgi:hypothetical protein